MKLQMQNTCSPQQLPTRETNCLILQRKLPRNSPHHFRKDEILALLIPTLLLHSHAADAFEWNRQRAEYTATARSCTASLHQPTNLNPHYLPQFLYPFLDFHLYVSFSNQQKLTDVIVKIKNHANPGRGRPSKFGVADQPGVSSGICSPLAAAAAPGSEAAGKS